ncbi:hypothetical protein AOE01nite_16850 [Acetobacter oeni]|uniref:Uncharacterized protein n=1 Tax=Acetobacter oeni TaxID=304077 RepID=A0A511XKJ3_9PROT|nr:hypothetical protein AOE01nite_16850 [Acetobacter oeni]
MAQPDETDSLPPAGGITGTSLLGLQEESDSDFPHEDKVAFIWGDDTLKTLRAIQLALLEGRSANNILETLETMCRESPPTLNPGLTAAVRAIRVRAAVELAKLHKAEARKTASEHDRRSDEDEPA